SQADLCELAAGIGSDVAFGLAGGTAVGVGRGERGTPALAAGSDPWGSAFRVGGLSTAHGFAPCRRNPAARGGRAGTAAPGGAAGRPRRAAGRGGWGRRDGPPGPGAPARRRRPVR